MKEKKSPAEEKKCQMSWLSYMSRKMQSGNFFKIQLFLWKFDYLEKFQGKKYIFWRLSETKISGYPTPFSILPLESCIITHGQVKLIERWKLDICLYKFWGRNGRIFQKLWVHDVLKIFKRPPISGFLHFISNLPQPDLLVEVCFIVFVCFIEKFFLKILSILF